MYVPFSDKRNNSHYSDRPSKVFLIPEEPALTQANQVYDLKLPHLAPDKTYNVRIKAAFVSRSGIVTEYAWPKNMVRNDFSLITLRFLTFLCPFLI